MMPLVHYSKRPVGQLSRFSRKPDNKHSPGGLWLSDDAEGGWLDLVRRQIARGDQDWIQDRHKWAYMTPFVVALDQILWLKVEGDLHQFAESYREPQERDCGCGYGLHIEWERAKADYKGVLISPYQDSLSHRNSDPMFHWYRFDCASGCVWDTSCLTRCGNSTESQL